MYLYHLNDTIHMKDSIINKEQYTKDEITYLQKTFIDSKIDAVRLSYDALDDYIWYLDNRYKLWETHHIKYVAIKDKNVICYANTPSEIVQKTSLNREEYSIFCIHPYFDDDKGCLIGLYPPEALFNILLTD